MEKNSGYNWSCSLKDHSICTRRTHRHKKVGSNIFILEILKIFLNVPENLAEFFRCLKNVATIFFWHKILGSILFWLENSVSKFLLMRRDEEKGKEKHTHTVFSLLPSSCLQQQKIWRRNLDSKQNWLKNLVSKQNSRYIFKTTKNSARFSGYF